MQLISQVIKRIPILIIGGILMGGCFVINRDIIPMGSMGNQWPGWFSAGIYATNGERIFFTAVNAHNQRIRYSGGPYYGGMMMGGGGNLACVSCHGSIGRGGLHTMHMDVMDAPDIRISALSSEEEEEHSREGGHADEHGEYGLEEFRRAVVQGTHPDGEPLSRDMPRWRMNDEDLSDLFEYLASLP